MQDILIRPYDPKNPDEIAAMARIWNKVVEDGVAFPQEDYLNAESGAAFFASQTGCGVAVDVQSGVICGLYILHPNNVGRCGHIANASYAVSAECRGKHIGEKLVLDCLDRAREHGFRIMQFNAVQHARKAFIRADRVCAAWRDSRRFPHERRALRGHLPVLHYALRNNYGTFRMIEKSRICFVS